MAGKAVAFLPCIGENMTVSQINTTVQKEVINNEALDSSINESKEMQREV
jgi:hypothetical protein